MTDLHIPVLKDEVIDFFSEMESFDFYFDGTFGRGGHCSAILESFPGVKAVAFDKDKQAVEFAFQHYKKKIEEKRLEVFHQDFYYSEDIKKLSQLNPEGLFNGILVDLGVSSPQLDQGQRGFSFYHDGPLDMRMDQTQELSAEMIVNEWSESELIQLFKEFGEVFSPYRAVSKILEEREHSRIKTTQQLAELLVQADGWRKKGHHPATKYFLALRLKVNNEIERLNESLLKLVYCLKTNGRLAVLTFHSTEDRITKRTFKECKDLGIGNIITKKVVQVPWKDRKKNPRARSAKLRVIERI